jgi:hypothetical protein
MNETNLDLVRDEDCRKPGNTSRRRRYLVVEDLNSPLLYDEKLLKKKEIDNANEAAKERDRKLQLIHKGHSIDAASEIVIQERTEGTMKADKRVIAGKARSVKTENNKIVSVFDDKKKIFVPYDEFIADKVNKTEEKKNIIIDIPKIIPATTNYKGEVSSGTATVPVDFTVPKIDIKEEKKVEKENNKDNQITNLVDKHEAGTNKKKSDGNIIDEYIDILYGGI